MFDYTKQAKEFAEQIQNAMPKVSVNRNGYEIRTKVLELAKDVAFLEYTTKFAGVSQTVEKDEDTGEYVTKVEMETAKVPGADEILNIAEKFYGFINNSK